MNPLHLNGYDLAMIEKRDEMTTFSDMVYKRPDVNEYIQISRNFIEELKYSSGEAFIKILGLWNKTRMHMLTLQNISHVKYTLSTTDGIAREEKLFFDKIRPDIEEADVNVIRALLAHPDAEIIDREFGPRLRELFKIREMAFDPRVKVLLHREANLCTAYTDLLASSDISFLGKTYNLSTLAQFYITDERQIRQDSRRAQNDFFAAKQEELDSIFDALIQTRHERARILGYDNFIPLAYRSLKRLDYGPKEVESFRQQILELVVPIASKIRQKQAEELGIESLMFWDEILLDKKGSPKPLGNGAFLLQQSTTMYQEFSPDTAAFFKSLNFRGLFDLETYPGKACGGYCISLDEYRAPFIFSNFNGTKADVIVMTHECGHAFQYHMSRYQPILEYLWPTMDACEIHSMGMVYLTFPWMNLFFGKEAERFCQQHLKETILDLTNICLVDEFQHEVYSHPSCGSDERREIWRKLENKYQPWRNYGDLSYWKRGNYWQIRDHIFNEPFYYIDYALASLSALQLYNESKTNREEALRRYLLLCRLGGSKSFSELLDLSGLKNPLHDNCVHNIIEALRIK